MTGLIRCSRCGFAFQGTSTRTDGRDYSKYVDGGWTNKGVCSHLGIRKDLLEGFAIQTIKETLTNPLLIQEIEQELRVLIEAEPTEIEEERKRIIIQLEEMEAGIRNLTIALQKGVAHDSIYGRIKELEDEKRILTSRLASLPKNEAAGIDPAMISREVADFALNFEKRIDLVSPEEKKGLIKQIISHIIVDRDNNVVRFFVRKMPVTNPQLQQLLQNKKVLATEVASTTGSGGRT